MKKLVLILIFVSSLFGGSEYEESKKYLIQLCVEDGSSKKQCTCAFDKINEEIPFTGILEADRWMEDNHNLVKDIDEGKVQPTNDYLGLVELYDDFFYHFNRHLQDCKKRKEK